MQKVFINHCCDVVQYELAPGHVVNLLRVAGEPSVDLGVRQVASISFKQVAKRHWEPNGGDPPCCKFCLQCVQLATVPATSKHLGH